MKGTRVGVILLVFLIAIRLWYSFKSAPDQLTDYRQLRKIWLHSQYNLNRGEEFFGNMSDEDLRTYAALEYVRGGDPSKVNFEDPPLVKYLFGLSYRIFGSVLPIQFGMSILAVFLTYLLARRLSLSGPLPFLPSVVLAFDPLFLERSTTVNLDIGQVIFVLLSLVVLTKPPFDVGRLLLLGIAIGATLASKVVFIGLALLVFSIAVIFIQDSQHRLQAALILTFSSFFIYLASYAAFFVYHPLSEFVPLHLKIARLYRSYVPGYPWFEIFRILFLGQWRTWFAQPPIQPVEEYWLGWPLATLLSFTALGFKKIWRIPLNPRMVIFGWLLVYFAFQSTHVVFPRYLLLALPPLYLLAVARVGDSRRLRRTFGEVR